ncbi:Calcium-dependent lipid-binding (CaLB domain) family protein [Quillaja saponaria]|uniref:Calcium-dependent lipid-binding (CaLB domain) family protein n=1 Tax=Quillaja saponaria TaxID=32244 RepID=A0AAD7Q2A0_QUISA|nr:Calcium-dependent lipid-binding (CaLB domain) family protein [Quillaja saponaria]
MSLLAPPSQLLEINLISAQDLAPASKNMRPYAVMWLHPDRKLSTRVDQNGDNNPTWNEKFVFRVDEEFLNDDTSAIMIEIYTSAWIRDVLVGTVGVLVNNLLPTPSRSSDRKSKMRFVGLQIRRPSGRPQGILNIGVTLVEGTMRSMPIYSDLSDSAVGYWDEDVKLHKSNQTPQKQSVKENNGQIVPINSKIIMLTRSQSERTDTMSDLYPAKQVDSTINGGSEIGLPHRGNVNAKESLCSDVGPSPSVVAAAIAKGLYPVPGGGTEEMGSSILEDWTEHNSTEGPKTKIERWRTELPPRYDHLESKKLNSSHRRTGKTPKKPGIGNHNRGNGLFSCFGKVCGCEISITCGGGNSRKKRSGSKRHLAQSDLTFNESSIV